MSKARRQFTDEFKREAVKMCSEPGAAVTRVARNLGVDQSVLRRWMQAEQRGTMEMNPKSRCAARRQLSLRGCSASCGA